MMMKLLILSNLLATLTFAEWNVDNQQVYNPPPDQTPKTYANWQQQFKQWVSSSPVPNLNLSHYTTFPSLKWTQTSFTQTQVMIHEKTLYNKTSNTFTVDKYLADLDSRYGGIDSVLLWPTYPNIGNDDRNQYDLHYSFDLQQLTDLVSDFHSHGVKVLWPYNPWDLYTRNTGKSDMESMGDLIQQTGADGFNGDTMDGVNASFFDEMISRDYPIAIEPEYTHANAQFMSTNFMSWNYWSAQYLDTDPPMVSAWKAVTNSLVMGHICERWATDRSDGLQVSERALRIEECEATNPRFIFLGSERFFQRNGVRHLGERLGGIQQNHTQGRRRSQENEQDFEVSERSGGGVYGRRTRHSVQLCAFEDCGDSVIRLF